MKKKKPRSIHAAERVQIPFAALFRMFVLGALAVVAAAYAVYRERPSARAPAVAPEPTEREIPAPELLPAPSGSAP